MTTGETARDTLLKLLTDLEHADAGLIDFDPEKHHETLVKAEIKIDSYQYILQKYESRIAEIKSEIDQLAKIKSTLENRANSLEKTLLWIMKHRGLDMFPGVKHVLKIVKRKKVVMTVDEPDSQIFLKLPMLVKRNYCWDKRAFNRAFAADPNSLATYAKEEISESIKFDLKRTIDDE
jgi:hypothetical protein